MILKLLLFSSDENVTIKFKEQKWKNNFEEHYFLLLANAYELMH